MSIAFNGTRQLVCDIPAGTLDYNAPYTMLLWWLGTAGSAFGTPVALEGDGNNWDGWSIDYATTPFPQHFVKTGGTYVVNGSVGTPAQSADIWHHFAFRRDSATQISSRADARAYATLAHSTVAARTAATQLMIGMEGGDFFTGRLAALKIWTAALLDSEIDDELGYAYAKRQTNLWGSWILRTVADLTDYSGNGRDLRVNIGSPVTGSDDPAPGVNFLNDRVPSTLLTAG